MRIIFTIPNVSVVDNAVTTTADSDSCIQREESILPRSYILRKMLSVLYVPFVKATVPGGT